MLRQQSTPVTPSVAGVPQLCRWQVCPSRRLPVTDGGNPSPIAPTLTFSSTYSYALLLPLSSVSTTPVAWARSRRLRQAGPHSVSLFFLFSFLWPFNSLFISFGGCSACSGRRTPTTRTAELLSGLISQSLSCLCHVMPDVMSVRLYVLSSLTHYHTADAGAERRDATRKNNSK